MMKLVSTKFEVDRTIRYSVIAAYTLRDFATLTLDFLVIHSGSRDQVNPSTKFEDPMATRS